ncbi:hypothetical protein FNV43_RR08221 [Rhamnella rubrinervis]|uniref:Uncharacterized protein n=1 Tax=Rhamnella rubrinervis TaxID=2594499 RepID=A0A8K0HH86_9ROSA|nr:hypothetical protein FNV43_RR08221 [Rhamnella rubrinervis]
MDGTSSFIKNLQDALMGLSLQPSDEAALSITNMTLLGKFLTTRNFRLSSEGYNPKGMEAEVKDTTFQIEDRVGSVHLSSITPKCVIANRFLRFIVDLCVEKPLPAGYLMERDEGEIVNPDSRQLGKKCGEDLNLASKWQGVGKTNVQNELDCCIDQVEKDRDKIKWALFFEEFLRAHKKPREMSGLNFEKGQLAEGLEGSPFRWSMSTFMISDENQFVLKVHPFNKEILGRRQLKILRNSEGTVSLVNSDAIANLVGGLSIGEEEGADEYIIV